MQYIKSNTSGKNIFLVDMKKENNHFFSELAYKGIEKYIKIGKKILIFVNKKGYSSGIICKDCGYNPKCENCDIPISYHLINNQFIGLCHICKRQYNYISYCPNCGGSNIIQYGIGIQKVQEYLKNRFSIDSYIIDSDKVNSLNKIKKIVKHISNYNVLLATSLLISGINKKFFIPDLVIFQNTDISINIPDYSSVYKNFLYLYEGINNIDCKNYILQTYNPDAQHIKFILNNDFNGYKKYELKYRRKYNYPPYADMAVILYKDEIEERLFTKVNKLFNEISYLIKKYEIEDIQLYNTPPLIYKIYGKYRYHIILKGENLHSFLEIIYEKLKLASKGFQVDWLPENTI